MTRLLSLAAARKALGDIGRTKLYQLIGDGKLERRYLDGKPLVTEESVERYAASLPTGRGAPTTTTPEASHDRTAS